MSASVWGTLIPIVFAIFVAFVGYRTYSCLYKIPPLPELKEIWWGPGDAISAKLDTTIKPFKINVPDEVLVDLKQRLEKHRPFAPPLEGVQQHYGINTNHLSEIVEFWKTKYNWRQREQFLNKYPQFTTNIQGLNIHFIHVKPSNVPAGTRVLPLLMLHGWPGSPREFYEIIPLLTTPQKDNNFVFEVIAPSLPGYGFSQAAVRPGLGAVDAGLIFKNLMVRLGFNMFYVQGGDWGALIVRYMGTFFPGHILGLHSNMCIVNTPAANLKTILGSFYPSLIVDKKYESKMYPLSKFFSNLMLEFGYMHIQATKPDTLGVGLNDSPVGLAAYVLEKFTTWTNPTWKDLPDGGLKKKFKYEDLLDNIMIYWVSGSVTSSMRFYAENFSKENYGIAAKNPVEVPSACARFQYELSYQPDCILKEGFRNLLQSTDIDDGGHFAAFEVPKLLAQDIWSAIDKMDKWHKNVKNSTPSS